MIDNVEPILLVDDDAAVLKVCADALRRDGYEVMPIGSGQEALRVFAGQHFAAAIVDLVLPDIDGLTLLSALREADPDIVVVLMTGHASLESAIDAVRRGAYDYLRKPFTASDLSRVIARGLSQRRLAVQNRALLQELDLVNRDLMQKVRSATDELMAFISLGRRLDQADGPLPVLLDLTRAALQLTGASTAALFAIGANGALQGAVAEGEAAAELQGLALRPEDELVRRAFAAEAPLIIPQLRADPQLADGPFALLGLSSVMTVPLAAVSGAVGLMALFDPVESFTERQAALVKVIAAQASEVMALTRAQSDAAAAEKSDDGFVDLQELL